MGLLKTVQLTFRGFAEKVLDIDSTKYPESQFNTVRELLSREEVNISSKNLDELILKLKKKHLVDDISISSPQGSLLVSSAKNGLKEAITGASLFSYINSEIQNSEVILVKSNLFWTMLLNHKGKLYSVKAPSSLTSIELKAIARDVELFLNAELPE